MQQLLPSTIATDSRATRTRRRARARACIVPLLLLAALTSLPSALWAHGAGYETVDRESIAVRFAYVLGEPMTGADVRVFPPGEDAPWQVSRADRQGRFAFVPDRPGTWTVVGDDGAGHRVRAQVEVTASGIDLEAPGILRIPPAWLLGALLASLLINAGLVSALIARRRQKARGH